MGDRTAARWGWIAATLGMLLTQLPAIRAGTRTRFRVRSFIYLPFAGGRDPASAAEAERWLHQKLIVENSSEADYEFLQDDKNHRRLTVHTAAEYLDAVRQGAYAATTMDFREEAGFARIACTLEFLRRARPSRASVLKEPLWQRLPVRLIWWGGTPPDELKNAEQRGAMVADLVRKRAIRKKVGPSHTVALDYRGLRQLQLEELARGDLDGDGSEDALIQVIRTIQGGSYYTSELWVVRSPVRAGGPYRIQAFPGR